VERSQAHMLQGEAKTERPRRQDGRPVAIPQITVQVVGLEPQDVRVVERRTNGEEPAVFVEFGGDNCRVTLAGRLIGLQQVTGEVTRQLRRLEEAHGAASG
jgi:hypothetical protein